MHRDNRSHALGEVPPRIARGQAITLERKDVDVAMVGERYVVHGPEHMVALRHMGADV